MDRNIRMIVNRLLRPLIDRGIDKAARSRKPDGDLTKAQARQVKQTSRRARKALRVARRFGRF
jgi:hypothetical protein